MSVATETRPYDQETDHGRPWVRIDIDVPRDPEAVVTTGVQLRRVLDAWPGPLIVRLVGYLPDGRPFAVTGRRSTEPVAYHDAMRAEVEAVPGVRRCILEWPEG